MFQTGGTPLTFRMIGESNYSEEEDQPCLREHRKLFYGYGLEVH